jgi:hypothetical protein
MSHLGGFERTFAILREIRSDHVSEHSSSQILTHVAYNLNWVVDASMSSELGLDVHVTKHAFFKAQSLSMRP